MYKNKSFLALIPARGGSKGLPGKNIKKLENKPLISWSIDAAKKSKYVDRTIISTDDKRIIKVAKEYGAEVPFVRPANLASDSAKMMDVISHAMNFIEENGKKYDFLVLLQPTSPFRGSKQIDEAIKYLFENNAKVVLGVVELEHSPLRANTLPKNKNMESFYNRKLETLNRQEMKKYYRLNGAIYIAEWDFLRKQRRWFSQGTYAYLMDRKHSVDIDNIEDFLFAQSLLDNSLIKKE